MPYKDPESQRAYQRNWMRKRRTDWLAEHGPCARCRTWDMLQVDHVDPDQKVDHRVWSWAEKRRAAELAKCQVLCARCHRAKTDEHSPVPPSGRRNHSRLKEPLVRVVKLALALGVRDAELAALTRMSRSAIRDIRLSYTWRDVEV